MSRLLIYGDSDGAGSRLLLPKRLAFFAAEASGLLVHLLRRTVRGMLDWTQCSAVVRVPGKVSGVWVFKGTRVPVQALFENLEGGATVDQFLEWFPGVTREQVLTVLKFAESSLAVAAA